ncbi:hypothetical protein O3M35_001199 [Rhynocoris fuscipes]|uniref:Proton-coupled folate transporter n=1 Tax=Rhynocoris fuscipes TaxID=488301 RepID=A0AAW1DQ56_9HEMI
MNLNLKLDITIEPVIFLLAFSNGLSSNGGVNLIMAKVCHDYQHETLLSSKSCFQRSADLNTIKTMLKECLPIVPLLLGGAWRDRHGKNIPLIILLISGQIVGALVCLLSSIFLESISAMVTVLAESIVTGLTGSLPLIIMTATCFITARTTIEDRTYRMSFVLAAYLGGLTLGLIMSGIMIQNFGFITLYSVATILAALSLVYVCLMVTEVAVPSKEPLPIWLMFKIIFKKRDKYLRPILLSIILVHSIYGAVLLSEGNVFVIFLENSLKFSLTEAGLYSSYKSIMLALSTFIVVPLLSKYFKMKDVSLGIISSIVMCLGAIWTAFSTTRLLLALCPLTDLLKGGVFAVGKSIMTKCVGQNEIGQMLGAEFVIEACAQMTILPLYTYVYNKTGVTKFPGAFFMLSAIFSLIILICFCVIQFLTFKKGKQSLDEVIISTDIEDGVQDEPSTKL